VAKSSKLPFYTKFVVEENLAKIDELKERQKYWGRTFLICVFSMLPAVFATFVGFNFSHPFSITIFCLMILSEIGAIFFLLKLFHFDSKNHVFKKPLYFCFFYLGFFLIGICACICAYFNTTFIGYDDGSFRVEFNPGYFFFLFLPLYIGYIIFYYYAFMKCFAKYAHTK